MLNKPLIIFFLSLLFTSQIQGQPEEITQKEDAFANFLFTSELYDYATEEYEKLVYLNPENLEYLNKLIICYQKTNQQELILKRLTKQDIPNKTLVNKRIDLLIETQNAEQIPILTKKFENLYTVVERQNILFKTAIGTRSWNQAKSLYVDNLNFQKYKPIVDQIDQAKFKNPKLAAIMSSILPSSGRFYAKDGKDGLFSILFIASSGYQSYRRFKKSGVNSVGGWIYGSIAAGFYLSNIYGSYQAAKYYNKKLDDKIYEYAIPRVLHSN